MKLPVNSSTLKKFLLSAGVYYVAMLMVYGMVTQPIYPNETAKIVSLTVLYIHLTLPFVTLVYLLFLNAKNKNATAIQINLHWVIFGLSLATFFIMQHFERN